jgi:mRNA-degrading endonuclease RelE of RelBE toxin-antitoxin system
MDQNKKFLKKLSKTERERILIALRNIALHNTETMDVKKLTGHQDVFRARVGSIRIIFISNRNETRIIDISRRSDTTYNDF